MWSNFPTPRDQSCSVVHNMLEFVGLGFGKSDQERVAIVNSRRYKRMDCNMESLRSQVFLNVTQVVELEICSYDHVHDILISRQVAIKQNTQLFAEKLVSMVS